MTNIEILKRLYRDYTKKHLNKIILAMIFSILVAGSTSAIAWLLDPAIDKIFINKDESLILIIPMLIILPVNCEDFFITFLSALRVGSQISFGLCSTQPFFGKYCLNSNCDINFVLPFVSNKITLVDVVPWSIATRNFFTILIYAKVFFSFLYPGSN